MNLSEEQVLAMAPDDSSRKSGKDLANPAKWVSKGTSENAMWGECQGSGSKPYQTQIDTGNLAFRCSCPSRKFPCKHGLGLLLLHIRQPQLFAEATPPEWVSEWLAKRTEKEEKKAIQATQPARPVDEAAQAKRQLAREQKVQDGIEDLLLWIKDIVRNGIVGIPEKNAAFWENMSRRMVDAQAPGLAGMLRELSQLNFYQEGWQHLFLDQLLRLYLVIQGYRHTHGLPEGLQQDIRNQIGFNRSQEELKAQPGITDTWQILGKQTTEDERLITERYWLYGIHTGRPALILHFYMRNQVVVPPSLSAGTAIDAELVYYPGAVPLRALLKTQTATTSNHTFHGFENWQEVVAAQTATSAALPWYNEQVYTIASLTPVLHQDQWWLQDSHQQRMPIRKTFPHLWKLLSLSGGAPLHMAVTGRETQYEPIGVWHQQVYKAF
ncbi:SWIM zinc finger family protein [Chitinophaga nivalis]|uniref:SWIM zinc finger family protein n=1 Tax=Chitinophaga nivalis TaxID=2991709 RepID=A0ABT3III7_9BACT|nr:SWIM zinc finger family protein [Chitinophaga nivalis]MCW3466560.1 SWIM zinc finger family protein [Chitinophaga nivalis]MCW3483749.1 SWIM zinc finger family protein [Chitinophaga nivalis]